jgi:hypothetical protein
MAICAGDWPMRRRPHPRQRITKGARCPWQAKLGLPEAFRRFLRTPMDFVLQEDGPAYVGPDTAAQPGVGERPQRHPAQDGADRG